VLAAQDFGHLLGYAMIRAIDAAGSWQWGDQIGVLETLVVGSSARGAHVGQALLDAAHRLLADWDIQVMTISVVVLQGPHSSRPRGRAPLDVRSRAPAQVGGVLAGRAAVLAVELCRAVVADEMSGTGEIAGVGGQQCPRLVAALACHGRKSGRLAIHKCGGGTAGGG
jgi:hypothetical protein